MSADRPEGIVRRDAIKLVAGAAALPLLPGPLGAQTSQPQTAPHPTVGLGRDQDFNQGWRFARGAQEGAQGASFDDRGWREVDLPHDWGVEDLPAEQGVDRRGPFDPRATGGGSVGFTIGGEGWYRKTFRLAALPDGARVELLFDGAYEISDVWLNGASLGDHLHGYTPFALDLTPHVRRNADNILAVRVRNEGENSRWYAGSGLYRQVRIDVIGQEARIARWGVGAWTRRIDDAGALVEVATRIEAPDAGLEVRARLLDAAGRVAAERTGPAQDRSDLGLAVRNPRTWSPDSPNLYMLEVALMRGATVIDQVREPYGIRIIAFDPDRGMTINGAHVPIRGGCVHHDNGLLGAAAFPAADERRIALLKARGFNAVRSSHNPSSRTFREACDRQGMLLIEEAFDMWSTPKNPQDYSTRFEADWRTAVQAMVLSARNSPSVFMWSIGNEIPDRASRAGVETGWNLANEVHRLDPTRPVTAGLHGALGARLIAAEGTAPAGAAGRLEQASSVFLDVVGYNYRLDDIAADHQAYPHRIAYASETYAREMFDYAALQQSAPNFLGEFLWTSLDYLGEAAIGAAVPVRADVPYPSTGWPWVVANCGDIDLIGQQRPQSFARDVAWGRSPLEMAVQRPLADGMREFIANWGWSDELRSWTWPGAEGRPLKVRLYTPGDRVELKLDGRVVATKGLGPGDKMTAEFAVPYAPGTLEAIAYRNGREIGRRRLSTHGAAARLRLRPERPSGDRRRLHVSFVTVEVLDAAGQVLPDANVGIDLTIAGPAEIAAFGSANPFATGSLKASHAQSYRGRALVILRSKGQAGTVRIGASSRGLAPAEAAIALR